MRPDYDNCPLSNRPAIVRSAEVAEVTREQAQVKLQDMFGHESGLRAGFLWMHECKGYKALGFATLEEFADKEFSKSRDWLMKELKAAKIEQNVDYNLHFRLPFSALRYFPAEIMDNPEMIQAIVERALELADGKKPAVAHYQQASEELLGDDEEEDKEDDELISEGNGKRDRPVRDTGRRGLQGDRIREETTSEEANEDLEDTEEEDEQDREEAEARRLEKSSFEAKPPKNGDGKLAGAEETDEEFLNSLPLRNKLSEPCRRRFDTDALIYRMIHSNDTYQSFKRIVDRAVKAREMRMTGPYRQHAARLVRDKHPKDWLLCADCRGTGYQNGTACTTCKGGCGYVIY